MLSTNFVFYLFFLHKKKCEVWTPATPGNLYNGKLVSKSKLIRRAKKPVESKFHRGRKNRQCLSRLPVLYKFKGRITRKTARQVNTQKGKFNIETMFYRPIQVIIFDRKLFLKWHTGQVQCVIALEIAYLRECAAPETDLSYTKKKFKSKSCCCACVYEYYYLLLFYCSCSSSM